MHAARGDLVRCTLGAESSPSDVDREGCEDHCARDQKYDRHSEHESLSTFTAQPSRCSSEKQDQSEEHGEEGVVVSALVEHKRISEAAVGALVCGCGLGRSRRDVFLHLERTVRWLTLSNPGPVGHPKMVGEALLHIPRECGIALSTRLHV